MRWFCSPLNPGERISESGGRFLCRCRLPIKSISQADLSVHLPVISLKDACSAALFFLIRHRLFFYKLDFSNDSGMIRWPQAISCHID